MHRDDEPHLKAAFAELHCRQREQAPPFGAMRERAMRAAEGPRRRVGGWALSLGAATACVVAAAVWWAMQKPAPRGTDAAASAERVEQLLDAIEHDAAIFSPVYSTDILLTQNDAQQTP
ncbi:MAG: hypothetical protein ABMA13_04665 [Chthoniobacteraceae bacterium]